MPPSNLDALYQIYWESPQSAPSPDGLIAGVRAYALRITRDDDIAQDVAIIVMAKLDRFRRRDATAFARWVNTIIRRTRLNAYDKSSDHTELFDESVDGQTSDDTGYVDTSKLPDGIRIVADKLLAGYSLTEISSQMNVTPAALRNKLARFRKSPLRKAA